MIITQKSNRSNSQIDGINSTAFFSVTTDINIIHKYAARIVEDLAFKLRRMNKVSHSIQLVAWNAFGKDSKFSFEVAVGVNDTVLLLHYVTLMLEQYTDKPIPCHGLSICATELAEDKVNFAGDKWGQLSSEMDALKVRYGQNLVRFAAGI